MPEDHRLRDAQRLDQPGWRLAGLCRSRRKVHFDPVAMAFTGEPAAAGIEAGGGMGLEVAVLPEDVGGSESSVSAEINFNGGSEPSETVAAFNGV